MRFSKIQRETARGLFEIFEKFHQVNRPFTLRIPRDNARINFVREKIPPAKKFSLRKKKQVNLTSVSSLIR
jgi:hypothetical protein